MANNNGNGNGRVRDTKLKYIQKEVEELSSEVKLIKDNHLPHMKEEMGDIKNDVTSIKERVAWMSKLVWLVLGGTITGLIATFYDLFIKHS